MWWAVGYVTLLAVSAALFTWLGLHERWLSALGTLLSVAGLQLALTGRVPLVPGMLSAAVGATLMARDVAAALLERAGARPTLAHAVIRRARDDC